MILLAPGLNCKVDEVVKDNDGRFLFLKGELLGHKLLLGNLYAPTRERVQYIKQLFWKK